MKLCKKIKLRIKDKKVDLNLILFFFLGCLIKAIREIFETNYKLKYEFFGIETIIKKCYIFNLKLFNNN